MTSEPLRLHGLSLLVEFGVVGARQHGRQPHTRVVPGVGFVRSDGYRKVSV